MRQASQLTPLPSPGRGNLLLHWILSCPLRSRERLGEPSVFRGSGHIENSPGIFPEEDYHFLTVSASCCCCNKPSHTLTSNTYLSSDKVLPLWASPFLLPTLREWDTPADAGSGTQQQPRPKEHLVGDILDVPSHAARHPGLLPGVRPPCRGIGRLQQTSAASRTRAAARKWLLPTPTPASAREAAEAAKQEAVGGRGQGGRAFPSSRSQGSRGT